MISFFITHFFILFFAKNVISNFVSANSNNNNYEFKDYGRSILLNFFQNSTLRNQIQSVVSEKCSENIDYFVEDLENFNENHQLWTLQMLDASAKIPAGLLKLNLGGWMGNFDQCIEIESVQRKIKGNYCLGTMYVNLEEVFSLKPASLARKAKLFAANKFGFQNQYPIASYPSIGICVPDGCNNQDLNAIVVNILNLTFSLPFECQTLNETNPPLNLKAWCVIIFFGFILSLMISSTIYDVWRNRKNDHDDNQSILIAFSVYTNSKKLFTIRKNSSELSCLNGIRVLSMIWVIAGHSFSVTATGPVSNALDILYYLDETKSMIFVSGVNSVDTFLMVTGLLVVYNFMKSKFLSNNTNKFNLFKFYLHRYIRLTPSFLGVILVSMSLLKYMGSGPHWSFIVNYFQGFCEKNWWSALLYFQNYINVDQWCIGQTWYLNIDFQLYLAAPIFLLILSYRRSFGVGLLILAILTFISIPFYVTWTNQLISIISNFYGDTTKYQHLYYLKTHTRASPWFVGALFGYLIAEIKFGKLQRFKINKFFLIIGWCVSLILIPLCTFIGHNHLRSENYHQFENALYNSFLRPFWAASVGWITLACSTGNGGIINKFLSLPLFQILNKFTYSVYLLHVTMLYMIIYASKSPAYFSIFGVMYSFWGIAMLALALSIFWVLAFESPTIAIEKILFRENKSSVKIPLQSN